MIAAMQGCAGCGTTWGMAAGMRYCLDCYLEADNRRNEHHVFPLAEWVPEDPGPRGEEPRERRRPRVDPPPVGWLDGTPMDPEAVVPEPLPAIPGFPYAHAGVGVLITGPTGGGRSSLIQAGAYDAAAQGVRVAYLGSEVTEGEFNARAADLASRRGDTVTDEFRQRLSFARYLEQGPVIAQAWEHPKRWVSEMSERFDVVALDPLSSVAATLLLDFDKSNAEFVSFYDRLVQPLVAAGLVVLLLDNVGHALEAQSRAKGASAKQDRVDLTFSCKLVANPVGLRITAGKVRSVRAPFKRGDAWVFDRDTQRITVDHSQEADTDTGGLFKPTALMERVSRAIEAEPGLTRRALRTAVKGSKHDAKELALELLVSDGYVESRLDGQWPTHYSVRPFRVEAEGGPGWPPGGPGAMLEGGPAGPGLKGRGPGATLGLIESTHAARSFGDEGSLA